MIINWKEIGLGIWGFLRIFSYAMFYFLCFMGVMLTLLNSMYILSIEGQDITYISSKFKTIGYFSLIYMTIIMIDKITNIFHEKEDKK